MYRVFQNFDPPSTAKMAWALTKSMIVHQNIFNLKIICQISRCQTCWSGFSGVFSKKCVCMEDIGIFVVQPHLPLHFSSLWGNEKWWKRKWAHFRKSNGSPRRWNGNIFKIEVLLVPRPFRFIKILTKSWTNHEKSQI